MNLFKKIFSGKSGGGSDEMLDLVEDTLVGVFDKAALQLDYDIEDQGEQGVSVELYGDDEEALRDKDGQLLDAIQFFTKRVLQHNFPEERVRLNFDSNGFRDESEQALLDMADKLKATALEKKRSVYCKALPPKDRRIIHQHLSKDDKIKTRSIGDGHYKKIKIFPAGGGNNRKGNNQRRNRSQRNAQTAETTNS